MWNGDAEGCADECLVEDREVRTLGACRILTTADGMECGSIAREAEDGFGEVVPRGYAFVGEVVESTLIQPSTFDDLNDEACSREG